MVPILLKMKYQGYLEQLFSKCSCCGFSRPLQNNYICFSQQRWWQLSAGDNWRKWNLFWSNFILSRLLHLCTQCCIPLRWLAWLVPSLNLWSIEFATDLTSRVAWSKQAGVIIKWGGDWDVWKHGRWDQVRRQYCPRFNTTPSRLNRGVYSELNADAMETQEEVKAKHQTSQLFVQFDCADSLFQQLWQWWWLLWGWALVSAVTGCRGTQGTSLCA